MNTRKRFTRKQMLALFIVAGSFAYASHAGRWLAWLEFMAIYQATLFTTGVIIGWYRRRQVRRILAENPHLAYLLAIRQEFGPINGKDA